MDVAWTATSQRAQTRPPEKVATAVVEFICGPLVATSKVVLASGALAAGLVVGWFTSGGFALLAIFASLVAAGNGYAKAYSP